MARLLGIAHAARDLHLSRQVSHWTMRYARSRTIPVLVSLAVTSALFLAIWTSSVGLGRGYRTGNHVLLGLAVVAAVAALGFTVWLSVPAWGGRWLERLGGLYYAQEGSVTVPLAGPRGRMRAIGQVAGALFGAAILSHVLLGLTGHAALEHMQPVSALYVIPFTVFIALSTRSYLQLLFPLLYGLHAIALLSGVPLRPWSNPALDVPVTMVGYTVLAALVGHAYNRYALARVKRAARTLGGGEPE